MPTPRCRSIAGSMTGRASTRPRSARSTTRPPAGDHQGAAAGRAGGGSAQPQPRKEALVTALTSGSTGRPFRTYRDPWLSDGAPAISCARWRRPATGSATADDRGRAPRAAGHGLDALAQADLPRPARTMCWPRSTGCGRPSSTATSRPCARSSGSPASAAWPVHRPKAVVTVSETLDPITRQLLTDGFGAPVFDIYGSIEMGVIAWECEAHRRLPRRRGSVLMETAARRAGRRAAAADQPAQRAMPLIRYDQADLAVVGDGAPCPCGRRFRRLEAIQGRVMDSHPAAGRQPHSPLQRDQRDPRDPGRAPLPDRPGAAGAAHGAGRERRPARC